MRPAKIPTVDMRHEPAAGLVTNHGNKKPVAFGQLSQHVVGCGCPFLPHSHSIACIHATCQSCHMTKYPAFGRSYATGKENSSRWRCNEGFWAGGSRRF